MPKQNILDWERIKGESLVDQPTLAKFFKTKSQIDKYAIGSQRRKILNQKLVRFIAKDMRPLSVVRNEGFRSFVEELDPCYVLPTVNTIRDKLTPKTYDETMNKIQKELESIDAICLTTDGWTSLQLKNTMFSPSILLIGQKLS